jgi:hypothetical protein
VRQELLARFFGGAAIGLIALALDYFLLQHFLRTPISMGGGIGIWAMVIYICVPFLILQFAGRVKN